MDSMALPHIGLAYNIYSQVSAINNSASSLLYEVLQPGNFNLWDGCTNPISMFVQNTSQEIDVNNIKILLMHILNFISNRKLKNNREADIPFLSSFGQIIFDFVSSVFKGGWDQLKTNKNNKIFHELIKDKFTTKVSMPNKANKLLSTKPVKFSKLSLPQLLPRPLKFHGKNTPGQDKKTVEMTKLSDAHVSLKSINNILKIKEIFPELSNIKIKELNKLIFSKFEKPKPKINITTKSPSHK